MYDILQNVCVCVCADVNIHISLSFRLDMTELDLSVAKPMCTKDDLKRYRKLGLTLEEIVEVAMKLNALKGLGINLKIEDLFDEEGFSLADLNETLVGEEGVCLSVCPSQYLVTSLLLTLCS